MSFEISVSYMEGQALAKVEITGLSFESRSARKCRFQCVGWILDIARTAYDKVDPIYIVNPDFVQEALVRIVRMDTETAEKIVSAPDWRRRFEITWAWLDEQERDEALYLDYDQWHNYWPGFDMFNRTFFEQLETLRESGIARSEQYDPEKQNDF